MFLTEFQKNDILDGFKLNCSLVKLYFNFNESKIIEFFNKFNAEFKIFSIEMTAGVNRESFYVNSKKTHHNDFKIDYLKKINISDMFMDFINISSSEFDTKKITKITIKKTAVINMPNYDTYFVCSKEISIKASKILETADYFFKNNEISENIEWQLYFSIHSIDTIITIYNDMGITRLFENIMDKLSDIMNKKCKSIKKITVNPHMLDKSTFSTLNLIDYFVLEKSDGHRCIYITDGIKDIIITEGKIVKYNELNTIWTAYDAEYVNGEVKIFDIIFINNKILEISYEERIKLIANNKKEILEANCENIEKLLKNPNIDGIIFNERGGLYNSMKVYKWKPAELITFDFLVVPMTYKGTKPFISNNNLYILMTGCLKKKFESTGIKLFSTYKKLLIDNNIGFGQYIPVPFSPPLKRDNYIYETTENLKLCVAEFAYNNGEWKLLKIREDKTLLINQGIYGNDYFIALQMFNEIQNPLKIGDLCTGYFAKNKPQEYKNMTEFNNFVKFNIMKILRDIPRVLDIGSGKGQDIFLYNGLQVSRLYLAEPDKNACIEISKRLLNLTNAKSYKFTPVPKKNMITEIINKSFSELEPIIVDAIVCNFACHYFLSNTEDYEYFNKYCLSCSAQIVILTFFNYSALKPYLPLKNEKYNVENSGTGKIKVKHHFADNMYEENIIHPDLLIKKMQGYECIMQDSFGHYLKFRPISGIDAQYSSFYMYLTFRLKKNK